MKRLRISWLLLVAFLLLSLSGRDNSAIAALGPKVAVPTAVPQTPSLLKDVPQDHFQFVRIPAGTFQMGSPETEAGRYEEETQHQVTLSRSFEMQTTLVTQALWQAVMGSNPSHFKGSDMPVEQVSWNDVQVFIGKLNLMLGTNVYRLPAEAEWEYAARAGTTTPFWTGMNLTTDQANFDYKYEKTTPVKKFAPNPWGLYDMHGNVFQWVQDWYGTYASGSVTDPTGPDTGLARVIRGGSFIESERACRSALHRGSGPDLGNLMIGFRLAKSSP